MNLNEAYKLLGVKSGDSSKTIKHKYRELIIKVHPDSVKENKNSIKQTQLLNEAYELIKKDKKKAQKVYNKANSTYKANRTNSTHFKGKILSNAYTSRDIFDMTTHNITKANTFINIGRGKYLWEPDKEDFTCFIHSIISECDVLLRDVELALGNRINKNINLPSVRNYYRLQLFHLLSQDYINPIFALRKILKPNSTNEDGDRIYEISASLGTTGVDDYYKRLYSLRIGDRLYPTKLKNNRLSVANNEGIGLGNLTIEDDRLLYIVIPILQRNLATIKIVVKDVSNNRASRPYRINIGISLFIKIKSEILQEEIKIENYNLLCKKITDKISNLLKEYEETIL